MTHARFENNPKLATHLGIPGGECSESGGLGSLARSESSDDPSRDSKSKL